MTEKEKMLAHQMYDANYNKELHDERIAAKELCWEYNQLRPSNEEGQRAVLKKLLGKTGENFYITAPFWCDYGYNIELGENFYANHNLVILDCAKVKFGDNVFVAPDCGFHTAGHPIDFERRNAGFEYAYPITVGDNVWIGAGVQVMPGVTIGSNVVIGGGSVVVKDIPITRWLSAIPAMSSVPSPMRTKRPAGADKTRKRPRRRNIIPVQRRLRLKLQRPSGFMKSPSST